MRRTFNGLITGLGLSVLLGACAGDDAIEGVTSYRNLARTHQAGRVSYPQLPPVGGAHNPTWQSCGVYDEPVASELAVHSMEHGAVWITYADDASETEVAALTALAQGQPYVLVSPVATGLPARVVATAWGVQLPVERADDPRLEAFVATYAQGKQTPEPGAPCTGGASRPTAP